MRVHVCPAPYEAVSTVSLNGTPDIIFPSVSHPAVTFSLHTPEAVAVVTLTAEDLKAALHALADADLLPIASTIWKAFAKLPHV